MILRAMILSIPPSGTLQVRYGKMQG
jgi:hypothetical protein